MVTGSYPPMKCGVGDYTHKLVTALRDVTDLKVHVLTSALDKLKSNEDSSVAYLMQWRIREIFKYIKELFRIRPDVVHIQYPSQGFYGSILPFFITLAAYVMGFKVVQTWHEYYSRETFLQILPRMLTPGGLVVVRRNYKEKLDPVFHWGLKNKKMVFIKNASSIPVSKLTEEEKYKKRQILLGNKKRLIYFFGFMYPPKGVDSLFEIADPATDLLVITGSLDESYPYHQEIKRLANSSRWQSNCILTGYLDNNEIADYLAVADTVVFPFVEGAGEWNSSVHAARLNGSFVVTTSTSESGLRESEHMFYASPGDTATLKSALKCGNFESSLKRHVPNTDEWGDVAREHLALYKKVLKVK